ncbi:MAG: hypothetical protein AAF862_15555, partial [Pseudomonadota bacterium]
TAFARLAGDGLSLNGAPLNIADLATAVTKLAKDMDVNALVLAVGDTASSQQLVDVLVAARAVEDIAIQLVK